MKFRESNSSSDTTSTAAASTTHRRWFYSIIIGLCFATAIYVLRMSPSDSTGPSQTSSYPVTIDKKTNRDNGREVPIASSSSTSSLISDLETYVNQINARREQGPKLWSFRGKRRQYDMNRYNFEFDPENPKCPDKFLRATEQATGCPNEDIYLALWTLIRDHRRPEHRDRPLTFVDVGSNKGYSIAGMIETLNLTAPARTGDVSDIHYVDPARLPANAASSSQLTNNNVPGFFSREALALDVYAYAEKLNTLPPAWRGSLAGGCCDGTSKSPFHPSSDLAKHPWLTPESVRGGRRRSNVYVPEVEAFLIDGTRSHIEYVTQFFNAENNRYETQAAATYNKEMQPLQPPPTKFSFHYYQRAMSNKNGTTKFCDVPFGWEMASICDKGIVTPVTTLDELIPAHVQKIDILLTDTEGHDFDVLEGARRRWFRDGKVGIYVFETHYGPSKRPLSSIVGELESYGYTCYVPVSRTAESGPSSRYVARVSPMELCWRRDYDSVLRGWKNMVCAHETNFPELKFVFQELSRLPKENESPPFVAATVEKLIFQAHPWRNSSWFLNKK